MMHIFATMNTRSLCPKISSVVAAFEEGNFDVLALQEVDVNVASRSSVESFCRKANLHIIFGDSDNGMGFVTRVAILSRHPIRQICPFDVPDIDRACFAMMEFQHSKVLICSLYGHAGDVNRRRALISKAAAFAHTCDVPWVILGDFNTTEDSQDVAPLLASGAVFSLDDCFSELPASTRQAGHSRLDFGIASSHMFPVERLQFGGIADHDVVAYRFDCFIDPTGFSAPKRASLDFFDDVETAFGKHWDSTHFQNLMRASAHNDAWTFLSDVAEKILCTRLPQKRSLRSSPWVPQHQVTPSKSCHTHEPVHVRFLRRMLRRIRSLQTDQNRSDTRQGLSRDWDRVRSRHSGFESASGWNAEFFYDSLSQVLREQLEQQCGVTLRKWQEKMATNAAKQRAWVKRRAEHDTSCKSPSSHTASIVKAAAIHPVSIVQTAADVWCNIWNVPQQAWCDNSMSHCLQRSPRNAPVNIHLSVSGLELYHAASLMKDKAAGPDGWVAKPLLELPQIWWDAVAELWTSVMKNGDIPARWVEARVALIPKPDGGTRPLGITSLMWRIGAKVYVSKLRPWVMSWANHQTLGGLAGRGVMDAHHRICHATKSYHDNAVYVSQDLSKFFDKVNIEQAALVLEHLQAPAEWVRLLKHFYSSHLRMFSSHGYVHSKWVTAKRGLLQGCPFSPIVASAVMYIWSCNICRSDLGVDGCTYLDDRTFWTLPGASPNALSDAIHRSDAFDQLFGLDLNKDKCQVAAKNVASANHFGACHFNYGPCKSKLEVLGLVYDLHDLSNIHIKNDKVALLQARLKFIRTGVCERRYRQSLIRVLVIPMLVWSAGVGTIDLDVMPKLRNLVRHAFGRNFPVDTPPCILTELMTWNLDPAFAMAWASLQALVRFVSRPRSWHGQSGVAFLEADISMILPYAAQVLQDNDWVFHRETGCIQRTDSHGQVRVFELGVDNPIVLKEWLVDVFRKKAFTNCSRIHRNLKRSRVARNDWACGLDLQAPQSGICRFAGHRLAFEEAGTNKDLMHTSMATGCSFWFMHAGKQVPPDDIRNTCLCGLYQPSRPHLLWTCAATAHLRNGIRMPQDKAEERLFAVAVDEMPASPDASRLDFDHLTHVLRQQCLALSPHLFVATDGSVHANVAAFGIHIPGADLSFQAGVPGEDQSAFRAEVEGLHTALLALHDAVCSSLHPSRIRIVIVCDCQSAIALAEGNVGQTPILARRVQTTLASLREMTASTELFWIPSHGKIKRSWIPHCGASEFQLRAWNAKADAVANQAARSRAQGSARERWNTACFAARDYEHQVIHAAAAVHAHYRQFLQL